MSIAQKMSAPPQSSIPPEIRAQLAERRLDDLMKWYKELRSLYQESSGIFWVPSDLMSKAEVTPDDNAFLSDIGIAPIDTDAGR
jgi:hypothetical protein